MHKSFGINILKFNFRSAKKLYSNLKENNLKTRSKIPLLHQLSSEFEDVSYVAPIINSEEIRNVEIEEWRKRINMLKKYNFSNGDSFKIISRFPQFLKIPVNELEDNVLQWSLCNLGLDYMHITLINQPQLLSAKNHVVRKRIEYLQSICKSKKTLAGFLINCPNVIFDDWEYILQKFHYLTKEKRVILSEIFHSTALSKPLDLIKLRFNLLEKCGKFKKKITYPHKINKYEKLSRKNPLLTDIVDTEDRIFSLNVANVTLEEYETFSELFQNENDNCREYYDDNYSDSNSESDSDNDSDSDSDSGKASYRKHK